MSNTPSEQLPTPIRPPAPPVPPAPPAPWAAERTSVWTPESPTTPVWTPEWSTAPTWPPATPAGVGPVPGGGGPARRTWLLVGVAVAAIAGLGLVIVRSGSGGGEATRPTVVTTSPARTTTPPRAATTVPAPAPTRSTAPVSSAGTAGDARVTGANVSTVYRYLLGVTPDSSTVACIQSSLGTAEPALARFVGGAQISEADATAAFTPIATCASDTDFETTLVPHVTQVLGGSVDQSCITGGIEQAGVDARVALIVLAVEDKTTYDQQLYTGFQNCIV